MILPLLFTLSPLIKIPVFVLINIFILYDSGTHWHGAATGSGHAQPCHTFIQELTGFDWMVEVDAIWDISLAANFSSQRKQRTDLILVSSLWR